MLQFVQETIMYLKAFTANIWSLHEYKKKVLLEIIYFCVGVF